ncbi:hypothetical protein [Plantactinospora sp. WMMB782]|uniref:hypothetical protein n=1 Tax=Plantactinospora sp. WMMB782 TaxID=3404121 RepID=UPI003B95B1D4
MTVVLPPRTLADPDAVNRLDDGTPLPGDVVRAEQHDRQCRQSWDGFARQQAAMERAVWLDAHRETCDGCEYCEVAA